MRRYPLVALVALLVLLTAAGCGGGSKKSSAAKTSADTTPAATDTTAAATETTASTSDTSAANSDTTAASKTALARCPELAKLGTKFQAAFAAANASAKGDPAKQMENAAAVFDKFADSAPSEIRGDFKVFGKALTTYAKVLAKVHFTPGKAPTPAQIAALTQASKSLTGPEFQKATAHIQAWTQSHCGSGFGN
jgi:hypothetical protein